MFANLPVEARVGNFIVYGTRYTVYKFKKIHEQYSDEEILRAYDPVHWKERIDGFPKKLILIYFPESKSQREKK